MKNILLLVHDDSGQEARLQAALDITRAVQGHLTCLDVTIIAPMIDDGYGVSGGAMLLELERNTESANRKRLEARLAREDVSWEWIDVTNYLEPAIEGAAALADLIVVNREIDTLPLPDVRGVAAQLVVKSGKPILAVPDDIRAFDAAGAALIAWDGSREASAALSAAVPLLALAKAVIILEVQDGSVKDSAEQAAAYLSRHDIHARILQLPADGEAPADIILADANSGKFAYLVMGGFGHSRLVEALFGGVTRKMLKESRIPLFLAH